jgi:hypothetical protein
LRWRIDRVIPPNVVRICWSRKYIKTFGHICGVRKGILQDPNSRVFVNQIKMPMELNLENLKSAFCAVVGSTGFGAAEQGIEVLYPILVMKAVQETSHADYAETLKQAALNICTSEPYGWEVTDKDPKFDEQTTFKVLFKKWFRRIINER